MDIFGIDLTSVPWPLFLLIIITAFFVLFYINIHLPMAEDLETYKIKFTAKLETLDGYKSELISLHLILDEIKRDQNGISVRLISRFDSLESHLSQLSTLIAEIKSLVSNRFNIEDAYVEKTMSRIDDIREKLLILITSINSYDINGRKYSGDSNDRL